MVSILGLAVMQPQRQSEDSVVEANTSVTITPFSRDKTLFDSGAAVGGNLAQVPVAGTGTPGEVVEIRIREDGQAPTQWTSAGVIAADGTWSSVVSSERRSNWMRVEARIQSEPTTRALTSNRFGVGHVVALWGQSEIVRIRSTVYDAIPAEPLLSEDAVQAIWYDGAPVLKHLTNADPHTAALAAMANVFLSERPNEKFAIVFHAVAGSGFRSLVGDADTARSWASEVELHDFVTADGQHVGLPAISWFASPGAFAENYGDALFPLFSGKNTDGTSVQFPTTISYGAGSSYQADHWFGELYDYSQTRWVAYGPHRFDIGGDMQSAKVLADGSSQINLANKQAARESWRALVDSPIGSEVFLPLGLEPLTYQNGTSNGIGGWTDQAHPAGDTDDGAAMFARLTAHAILQASGLTNWAVPEFDQAQWQPDGSYVEIWSSAGAVTTPRIARGDLTLDDSFPHWTDVFGWQINGAPAQRAEIVNGRVRLYPIESSFVSGDVINYGEGGASGAVKFPQDFYAETFKNLPIVDVGAYGIDGAPVRPLPAPDVLANTLVQTSPVFATTSTGPHFADPQSLGGGVSKIHFVFDLSINLPTSGARTIMTTTGNYLKLEALPSGSLRFRVRDSAGVVLANNIASGSGIVTSGAQMKLAFAVDLQAGFARLWADDVLIVDHSVTSTSQELPSNRKLLLLATNAGSYQVEGLVRELSVWKDASADGSDPVSAVYKTITGPNSVVNTDLWKLGDDAV